MKKIILLASSLLLSQASIAGEFQPVWDTAEIQALGACDRINMCSEYYTGDIAALQADCGTHEWKASCDRETYPWASAGSDFSVDWYRVGPLLGSYAFAAGDDIRPIFMKIEKSNYDKEQAKLAKIAAETRPLEKVSELFASFCQVTVKETFHLEAKKIGLTQGSTYLVTRVHRPFDQYQYEILIHSAEGDKKTELAIKYFDSNCDFWYMDKLYGSPGTSAVVKETKVYADSNLTELKCTIPPQFPAKLSYEWSPRPYELEASADLARLCDGLTEGYTADLPYVGLYPVPATFSNTIK